MILNQRVEATTLLKIKSNKMKKIILSLSLIAIVAVVAVGATTAFYSDTETSSGNTFTAGAIDLKVDSQAHYAGLICDSEGVWVDDQNPGTTRPDLLGDECSGTWTETDLGASNMFFNLSDLKPGDEGENTISLHVLNNDAYACVDVDITSNDDVSSTEPELEDGDVQDSSSTFDGELASELRFFAWGETDGDNVWEEGEPALFSNTEGPASDVLGGVTYPLFTPSSTSMAAGTTQYIGLYWCFGDITVGTNTLSCNGASVDNMSQTDQMTADVAFRVEQARNNPNFTCTRPLEDQ